MFELCCKVAPQSNFAGRRRAPPIDFARCRALFYFRGLSLAILLNLSLSRLSGGILPKSEKGIFANLKGIAKLL
jgi:hypothetical protein